VPITGHAWVQRELVCLPAPLVVKPDADGGRVYEDNGRLLTSDLRMAMDRV